MRRCEPSDVTKRAFGTLRAVEGYGVTRFPKLTRDWTLRVRAQAEITAENCYKFSQGKAIFGSGKAPQLALASCARPLAISRGALTRRRVQPIFLSCRWDRYAIRPCRRGRGDPGARAGAPMPFRQALHRRGVISPPGELAYQGASSRT